MVNIVVTEDRVSINWEEKGVSKAIICQPNEVEWTFADFAGIETVKIAHSEVFRIFYDSHIVRTRKRPT